MTGPDQKEHLHRYLRNAREVVLWKLDGLGEYDIRRPLTPTGTNLLGLIKHLASVESGYFGEVFGRPFGEQLPWSAQDAEPNTDMWATPAESREDITGFTAASGRTPTPPSKRCRWTHSARCRGGLTARL